MNEPRWQNWLSLILGIYIAAAPWVVPIFLPQTSASTMIEVAGLIAGLALAIVSMSGIFDPEIWTDWVKVLLGMVLLVIPWVADFSDNITFTYNFVLAGMVLIIISGLAFASRRPKIGRDWQE